MNRILAAAAIALAASASAHAAVGTLTFHGIVSDPNLSNVGAPPANTTYQDGDTLSGSLTYDTVTGAVTSLNIGPYSSPAGATITASTADPATYQELIQYTARDTLGNVTEQLTLDLETAGSFDTTNLAAFLATPQALDVDPNSISPSTIDVFVANASGGATTIDALLVPEPAAALFLAPALAGLAFLRRRV